MKTFALAFLLLCFTGVSAHSATPAPMTATMAVSAAPPYTAGESANLVITATSTLPASVPAQSAQGTANISVTLPSGATAVATGVSVLYTTPAINNLQTNVSVVETVSPVNFTVGTLPSGVTWNAATGAFTWTIGNLDGLKAVSTTVPITFPVAIP